MKPNRRLVFSVDLDDCEVQTFTVGGHGGAGKDTSNTGVRILHRASGATGVGRDERSQIKNKRAAFRRMAESPLFQAWARRVAAGLTPEAIERWVVEQTRPHYLRVEYRDHNGKWTLDKPEEPC